MANEMSAIYECVGFSLEGVVTGEPLADSSRVATSVARSSPNGGDEMPLSGDVLLSRGGVHVCADLVTDPGTDRPVSSAA